MTAAPRLLLLALLAALAAAPGCGRVQSPPPPAPTPPSPAQAQARPDATPPAPAPPALAQPPQSPAQAPVPPPQNPPPAAESPSIVHRKKAPVTDRPNLGVQLLAARPGEIPEGIRVNFVFPESAAQAMGVQVGDEVLELNGVQVQDAQAFTREVGRDNIGSKVALRVRRGGETLELKGLLGSAQKTRRTFHDRVRQEQLGKPFEPGAPIEWVQGGAEGLKAIQGKLGLVVSFHNCPECVGQKWQKVRDAHAALKRGGTALESLGFVGIYADINQPHEKNVEGLKRVLAAYPAEFPVGLARYPQDRVPPDSLVKHPLVQDHGVALVDPEGKVIYIELDNPGQDFVKAFAEAQAKFGKKGAPTLPPAR